MNARMNEWVLLLNDCFYIRIRRDITGVVRVLSATCHLHGI